MTKRTCKNCGKDLSGTHWARKYCSKSCYYAYHQPQKKERVRLEQAIKKAHGICITCGRQDAEPGKTKCWACAMNDSDTSRLYYEKRKDRNICTRCGAKPAVEGKTCCTDCLEEQTHKAMSRWNSRKAAHLCPICESPLPKDYKFTLCPSCRRKKASSAYDRRHAA